MNPLYCSKFQNWKPLTSGNLKQFCVNSEITPHHKYFQALVFDIFSTSTFDLNLAPLKGIPSLPTSARVSGVPALNQPRGVIRPGTEKKGGIKVLDITEQPLGYAQTKRRKKMGEYYIFSFHFIFQVVDSRCIYIGLGVEVNS